MKDSTFKIILNHLKKRVKPKMLLILAITFSLNTFAWFIYANKVEGGIGAKVKAWNVLFEIDGQELSQNIDIVVEDLYPGKHFTKDITVTNKGDTEAELSFEISSVTILGTTSKVEEGGTETSDSLLNSIMNDYPFKIIPSVSNSILAPNTSEKFNLSVNWPFDSGNDELDTLWGDKAYNYTKEHPNTPCIKIEIKINAIQKKNTT